MIEDFPQPNPDELQQQGQDVERAVAEDAARAGEVYQPNDLGQVTEVADEAGEHAVATHVGVQHVDETKAESMANAGKDYRDQAAEWRKASPYGNTSEMLLKDPVVTAEGSDGVRIGEEDWPPVNPLEERMSKANDLYADRIEELTGILHDRTISEEYAATHEGIDFSAEALAIMEIRADKELARAAKNIAQVKAMSPSEVFYSNGVPKSEETHTLAPGAWFRDFENSRFYSGDDVAKILDAPGAKVEDYTNYIKQLYIERELASRVNTARAAKVVVEDVRSGRALQ